VAIALLVHLTNIIFVNSFIILNNNESRVLTRHGSLTALPQKYGSSANINYKSIVLKPISYSYHHVKPLSQSSDPNNESSNHIMQQNQESPYAAMLRNPKLILVDALSITLFAALGKTSHSNVVDGDSIGFLLSVLMTALPFLLSWFTITPLLGCYNDDSSEKLSETILKGWAISIPIGIGLRGLIKGYVPPTPFIIVTMISTLVIIGVGRFGYAKLLNE